MDTTQQTTAQSFRELEATQHTTARSFRERCIPNNLLVTYSLPFLCIWSLAIWFGVTRGVDFLSETSWSMTPPAGSASVRARDIVVPNFPQKRRQYAFKQAVLIVALHPDRTSVTSTAVRDLTAQVINSTLHACPSALPLKDGLCWWREAFGIFVPEMPADFERSDYVSDNETATMIVLTNNYGFGVAGNRYQVAAWQLLEETIDKWQQTHPLGSLFQVGTTHEQMLLDAAQKGVISDFEHGDMATLPIAFIILLLACGPPALLVLVTLPVTLLSSFWVLSQIATGAWLCTTGHFKGGRCPGTPKVNFPSFVPAILINMIIALSLDYSLFLLTRCVHRRAALVQQ